MQSLLTASRTEEVRVERGVRVVATATVATAGRATAGAVGNPGADSPQTRPDRAATFPLAGSTPWRGTPPLTRGGHCPSLEGDRCPGGRRRRSSHVSQVHRSGEGRRRQFARRDRSADHDARRHLGHVHGRRGGRPERLRGRHRGGWERVIPGVAGPDTLGRSTFRVSGQAQRATGQRDRQGDQPDRFHDPALQGRGFHPVALCGRIATLVIDKPGGTGRADLFPAREQKRHGAQARSREQGRCTSPGGKILLDPRAPGE
jgi:hypothetical protein